MIPQAFLLKFLHELFIGIFSEIPLEISREIEIQPEISPKVLPGTPPWTVPLIHFRIYPGFFRHFTGDPLVVFPELWHFSKIF